MNPIKVIGDTFKRLVGAFLPYFRDGIERFIKDNLSQAIQIAWEILQTEGFDSGHEFWVSFWSRLQSNFRSRYGTWITVLGGLALDAVKKVAASEIHKLSENQQSVVIKATKRNPWLST